MPDLESLASMPIVTHREPQPLDLEEQHVLLAHPRGPRRGLAPADEAACW